ncbi:hypothetical protein [Deinococcus enclensis]|uniref:Spore coat protein U domain-containing protein n=1 Tax=Deinococcus enclensis TaxID=1049582 RepID=A0ABT9MFZ6_9DEIO|nr:hypothetical protein [Deinococcus enclensis]MDP9765503.1 hypothetical protein [Deinococcus enclensis]
MRTFHTLFALLLGATLTAARAAPTDTCTPRMVSVIPVIQYDALRTETEVIRVTVEVACFTKQAKYTVLLGVTGTQIQLLRGAATLNATLTGTGGLDGRVTFGNGRNALEPDNGQGPRTYRHEFDLQVVPGQWGSEAGTYTLALPLLVTTL